MRLVICGNCHKFVGYSDVSEKVSHKRVSRVKKPKEFEESQQEDFDLWE